MTQVKLNLFLFLGFFFLSLNIFCATITVTSSANSGAGTLRQAVIDAGSGDTIEFDGSVTQIDLTGSDIDITKNLTISGNGADVTKITGSSSVGIFFINASGINVTIKNLTMQNGRGTEGAAGFGGGGAIFLNQGTLTVENCEFRDNIANHSSGAYGGACHIYDDATFLNCTFDNNSTGGSSPEGGGAIYMDQFYRAVDVAITNCTFNDNSGDHGGGINVSGGGSSFANSLTITNSTFFNNTATAGIATGDDIAYSFGNQGASSLVIHNSIFDRSSSSTQKSVKTFGSSGSSTSRGGNIFWDNPGGITPIASDDANQGTNGAGITSTLAANNTLNGARTLSITGAGSLATDNGTSGFDETTTDARGALRNGTIDSGAYEFWVAQGVLPVELTFFRALPDNGSVKLIWQTATELNNYGFEVERQQSENGTQNTEWETIGFVKGHGNSNSPKSYSYLDKDYDKDQELRLKYRLKQIDTDGSFTYYESIAEVNNAVTTVEENPSADGLPKEFSLSQNYPNPFNPSTTIEYSIPNVGNAKFASPTTNVQLIIYDILGNEVSQLVNKHQPPGLYEVEFDASNLSSGLYICRIKANSFIDSKKMLLIK